MLEPQGRRILFDTLRPPAGYRLDEAIGTTFSLDLLALLTVPLAFTLFDWEEADGRPTADPLALIEALRRHAGRVTIFCQTARISVPPSSQLLFGYLEGSVVEVTADRPGGVFHPKTWLLRFSDEEGSVLYRFACLTRNLTFDRSWDTVLVLEGPLTGRTRAYSRNHPLGDFIAALPNLSSHVVEDRVRERIDRLQDEVRRVDFQPPEGLDLLGFHPLGVPGHRGWPFQGRVDRLLVMSPFLSPGMVRRLGAIGSGNLLISRVDSLGAMDETDVAGYESVSAFTDAMDGELAEGTDDALSGGETALSGLHAKLYIADAGWDARLWTGSANATAAAFKDNVEFLVELGGKKSRCGIDALLEAGGNEPALEQFIRACTVNSPDDGVDRIEKQLESLLERARGALAAQRFRASVSILDEGLFTVALKTESEAPAPADMNHVQVSVWPVTLPQDSAARLLAWLEGEEALARFERVSFEGLTRFFAFELSAEREGKRASSRFVLKLPADGMPGDREERLLRSLLKSRREVLRYLLFLLSESDYDALAVLSDVQQRLAGGGSHEDGEGGLGIPLLEMLLRTLARDPERLDRVARLVDDLGRTPEGTALLPERFDEVWGPIWAARLEVNDGRP